jgi:hypothetical protein
MREVHGHAALLMAAIREAAWFSVGQGKTGKKLEEQCPFHDPKRRRQLRVRTCLVAYTRCSNLFMELIIG